MTMDANILYNAGTTENTLKRIEAAVTKELKSRKTEYNNIIALFEKSDCEQADALRALLQEESRTIEMLAELLTEMVHMLQKAAADTSHVEDNYSVNRVKG